MPENIASFGYQIDDLALLITIIVGVGLIISEAVLFFAIYAFRKTKVSKAQYLPGNTWRQAKWVLIPVLLVVIADFFIDLKTHGAWEEIKGETPSNIDYTVRITGQQFLWNFTYPDQEGRFGTSGEFKKMNELHVPVNKTIRFHLDAKDVLHSFWVPSLRLKQDAIPGRTITGWFRPTKEGKYDIACAEICGVGHTLMRATLFVHSADDFARWRAHPDEADSSVATAALSPQAQKGALLIKTKGCIGCHSLDGSKLLGPSYKGIFGRKTTVVTAGQEHEVITDEAYINRSILEPQADVVKGFQPVMPPQRANLTDDEVSQIVEYLKTIQ